MDAEQQEVADEALRMYGRVTRDATRRALALRSRYALAVLNIYASYARSDGMTWPTKDTVARELGMPEKDKRRISEAVVALLEAGLMVRSGKAKNTATTYHLPWLPKTKSDQGDAVERSAASRDASERSAAGRTQGCGRAPEGVRQSAPNQIRDQIRTDHTPPGSVNHAALAGEDEEARSARQAQEAAPPPAGKGESLAEREEREEQEGQARRLVDEGLFTDRGSLTARYQACLALVRAYRRRWPCSWPSDWAMAADFPQLTGSVKDRPAWIATHLAGYSNGWMPENQDGSVRVWHSRLLHGDLDAAMKAAKVENGYAPERASAAMKAREQEPPSSDLRELMENISAIQDAPATGKRRKPRAITERALDGLVAEQRLKAPSTPEERALQARLDLERRARAS